MGPFEAGGDDIIEGLTSVQVRRDENGGDLVVAHHVHSFWLLLGAHRPN